MHSASHAQNRIHVCTPPGILRIGYTCALRHSCMTKCLTRCTRGLNSQLPEDGQDIWPKRVGTSCNEYKYIAQVSGAIVCIIFRNNLREQQKRRARAVLGPPLTSYVIVFYGTGTGGRLTGLVTPAVGVAF